MVILIWLLIIAGAGHAAALMWPGFADDPVARTLRRFEETQWVAWARALGARINREATL